MGDTRTLVQSQQLIITGIRLRMAFGYGSVHTNCSNVICIVPGAGSFCTNVILAGAWARETAITHAGRLVVTNGPGVCSIEIVIVVIGCGVFESCVVLLYLAPL